jgi:hypothetical protein
MAARLDKNGRWRTYSKASTNGGLPNRSTRLPVATDKSYSSIG